DNGNVWNTIKGGQTVPVKWKLYLYQGGPEITSTASVAAGWPRYASAACTALPQDAVETTSTGSTNLRYDTTSQQFIYNWQTPAGSGCYRLDVKFTDGRTYSAQFQTSR
ncbi:MAG TPA: PxKF domain-containing protein, partial [Chloroflexia bacterium]